MSGNEWEELSSMEVFAYYHAWGRRREQDLDVVESVLRFFDEAIARNSYLTISPHLKKGARTKVSDYLILPDKKQEKKEDRNDNSWAREAHFRMWLRSEERAREYLEGRRKRHG